MLFYIGIAVVLLFVVYIIINLLPARDKNGGSIDLFFEEADDEKEALIRAAREAEERLKYSKVYTEPGKQILVLFGTEYGFSGELAKRLFDALLKIGGVQPRLVNMKDSNGMCDLQKEQLVLVVCSTTGDGVPPTETREFIEGFLKKKKSDLDLSTLRYAVLALGDNNYPHFCRTGRSMDAQLKDLGAVAITNRVDVDQEDSDAINGWFNAVLSQIPSMDLEERTDYITERTDAVSNEKHNRSRPYWSKVLVKYELTDCPKPKKNEKRNYEEEREVVHIEFELPEESELSFTSGDALGVYPANNPSEVEGFLLALVGAGASSGAGKGKEKTDEKEEVVSVSSAARNKAKKMEELKVPLPKSAYEDTSKGEGSKKPTEAALKEVLTRYYDLKSVNPGLLTVIAKLFDENEEHVKDEEAAFLKKLLAHGGASLKENAELREFLKYREVMDVMETFPHFFSHASTASVIGDLLGNMKTLQPRYYSISSSPVVEKGKATVTAAVVRYETLSKERTGVATTFMADRLAVGQTCPVFISKNPDFRLPSDPSLPIIMVGPGTGIAPFRAFIQERLQSEGVGTNLLYFGCRNKDVDYLYKKEFEALAAEKKIELRTAFSRDQKEKIYVQHRLLEDAAFVWDLLEKGAHVYVCGDATRMAGDVHNALLQIIQKHGNETEEGAKAYMERLAEQKRYERDVWVT